MTEIHAGLDLELEVRIRANNMAKITGRLLQGLGASDSAAATAMSCVADQSIGEVEGYQLSQGHKVAYFRIKIDWEKSRMLVHSPDYTRTLPLASGIRVEEQVKQQLREVVRFFAAKRVDLAVDSVEVIYTSRPGYALPPELRPLTADERRDLGIVKRSLGYEISPGEYSEMGITYLEIQPTDTDSPPSY